MRGVYALVKRIAPHYTSVLVTGETGSGKDLIARALHLASPVSRGKFVVLNCSAVVETLFESELFGHVRGAFTGASSDKMGLLELANGGTLFLDEIGDMPLATQAKLLRVLQNREVQRVGSLTSRKIEFRLVAATNKDLRVAVANKEFREDLYYRLSMVEIHMPALRHRLEDLPPLTQHFIGVWSERFGKELTGASGRVQEILKRHRWPGNVREFENVIGHACMLARGAEIEVEDLPDYLQGIDSGNGEIEIPAKLSDGADDAIEDMEIRLIRKVLKDAGGNQLRAARLLNPSRDRLRYRMKKYGFLPDRPLPDLAERGPNVPPSSE
jgi:transcriptional regulator with PAS, ATPase and Fis domain